MNSLGKAVWYIENHLESDITLEDVAEVAGLSKFHLVRAFSTYSGQSVMRYVRARRLSEAAKRLAVEDCGILDVALVAGYGSHEAFTRAFSEQFGISPSQLQKTRSLENIKIVEPIKMDEQLITLPEPRFVDSDTLLIVGLKNRYNEDTSAQMPAQWQAFGPHIGHIDNQRGNVAFGVLCNSDDEGKIDYVTGVEVSQFPDKTKNLEGIRISSQTYAVFEHDGHVSDIRRTWKTIFAQWLPEANCALDNAPQLERYGEGFDPKTGTGDIEIWIPVAK